MGAINLLLILSPKDNNMILKNPIIITPRLLPGVQLANVFISVKYGKPTPETSGTGRQVYHCIIDGVGKPFTDKNLRSGCQGGNLHEGLSSFLYFLSVAGGVENANLFPKRIREWAIQNSDEITMLAHEVEETPDCIVE